jgi:hypothetical protein
MDRRLTLAGKPEKYGITAVPHKKFENLFACRIAVPFEGVFWVVDAANNVDVFATRDEAMAAGARALLPILNRRINFPAKHWPKPEQVAKRITEHGAEGLEYGFFAGCAE